MTYLAHPLMTLHCCYVQVYINLNSPSLVHAIIAILAVQAHIPSPTQGSMCSLLDPCSVPSQRILAIPYTVVLLCTTKRLSVTNCSTSCCVMSSSPVAMSAGD